MTQNLGLDSGSGQTPNSNAFFPDPMDTANQQAQQQQQPVAHVLAPSDVDNNQATQVSGGDSSHQNSHPPSPMDETRPTVSFPSQNHAQS